MQHGGGGRLARIAVQTQVHLHACNLHPRRHIHLQFYGIPGQAQILRAAGFPDVVAVAGISVHIDPVDFRLDHLPAEIHRVQRLAGGGTVHRPLHAQFIAAAHRKDKAAGRVAAVGPGGHIVQLRFISATHRQPGGHTVPGGAGRDLHHHRHPAFVHVSVQLIQRLPAPVRHGGLTHPQRVAQLRNLGAQVCLLCVIVALRGLVVLVQRVDLPLILQRHSGQQPRQNQECGPARAAPQTAATLFLGIAGREQIPHGVQRHCRCRGRARLRSQQGIHAGAQLGRQRLQIIQPRQSGVLLPLAQRLTADADFLGQRLLTEPLCLAGRLNVLPQCHILALFPCCSDKILPQSVVKCQQVECTKR